MFKSVVLHNNFLTLVCINYGAIIHKLVTKDKHEKPVNVVIGFKTAEDYTANPYFLGASLGRYAGRISGGGFNIDSTFYPIYSPGGVHLHGGVKTFSHQFWDIEDVTEGTNPSVTMCYNSPHLEEGYPGNLKAKVTYQLIENTLKITYTATTDRPTAVNLTNHSYFNLNGGGNILNHNLFLAADGFLALDEHHLPKGTLLPVSGSSFDFRKSRKIGSHPNFTGIDDCFPLLRKSPAAWLYSEESGIAMKVATNQPSLVIFTPQQLPEANYNQKKAGRFCSICFEAQNYPDAPNQPHFPSALLNPGELYVNETSFQFSVLS